MNDQPTPNTNPEQPPVVVQPQPTVPQPSASSDQVIGQPSIQNPKETKKHHILAWVLIAAGVAAFVGQLATGVFYLASVIIGVWPLYVGLRLKLTPITILASVVIGLNLLGFVAAFFL